MGKYQNHVYHTMTEILVVYKSNQGPTVTHGTNCPNEGRCLNKGRSWNKGRYKRSTNR